MLNIFNSKKSQSLITCAINCALYIPKNRYVPYFDFMTLILKYHMVNLNYHHLMPNYNCKFPITYTYHFFVMP